MKKICYQILVGEELSPKAIEYNEYNLTLAKEEAHNGEYIIEDDGQPDPVAEPTADDVLNALLGVM